MHDSRAQSALEYLLTYGWAILIIAIVIFAFFALGLFGSVVPSTACTPEGGFECQGVSLSHSSGTLSFTFASNRGQGVRDLYLACAANENQYGQPIGYSGSTPVNPFQPIAMSGQAFASAAINGVSLNGGQAITVSNLTCYGSNNQPLPNNQPLGTEFTGHIWAAYNETPLGFSQFSGIDPGGISVTAPANAVGLMQASATIPTASGTPVTYLCGASSVAPINAYSSSAFASTAYTDIGATSFQKTCSASVQSSNFVSVAGIGVSGASGSFASVSALNTLTYGVPQNSLVIIMYESGANNYGTISLPACSTSWNVLVNQNSPNDATSYIALCTDEPATAGTYTTSSNTPSSSFMSVAAAVFALPPGATTTTTSSSTTSSVSPPPNCGTCVQGSGLELTNVVDQIGIVTVKSS